MSDFKKTTEQESLYKDLDQMDTMSLLTSINKEDQKVAHVINRILPSIQALVDCVFTKMNQGGRLFYIGAGTSGRLGILDASECPPTFGVPHEWVVGLIAGGDSAIRKAVEFAEDDIHLAWKDLQEYHIDRQDVVVGIASSGTTPYVIHGLKACRDNDITTGAICCNHGSPMMEYADYPIEAIVGPEFVTGSTRMKSGTAQKMILNMVSTAVMIRLGRVKGNRMIDMQLSNNKLVDRGTKMIMSQTSLEYEEAKKLLVAKGSVREAIDAANDAH